jgi:hypothetical protein
MPKLIDSETPRNKRILLLFPRIGWVVGQWDLNPFFRKKGPFWNMDLHHKMGAVWIRANQPKYWAELPPIIEREKHDNSVL